MRWFARIALMIALSSLPSVGVCVDKGSYLEAHLTELQDAVSQSVVKSAAAVINSALGDYFSDSGSGKTASYAALTTAINRYITDDAARSALLQSVADLKAGKTVKYGDVATALLKGGLNATIGNSSKLSANEKRLALGVVNELAGIDGSLQTASIESLKHSLIKSGISEEKANAIGDNLAAYVSNTSNTMALKTAASIELQYIVGSNMGRKAAAVVNAAISEYLNGEKGATREAALSAVSEAINKYVKDESARNTLLGAIDDAKNGNPVNTADVGRALVHAGVMEAIDQLPGLTAGQRDFARAEAEALLNKQTTFGDVAKDAVGVALASALEKTGVSHENARQIGQGVTDILKNPENTANLVQGGVNAAIDAMPGLTPEQRARAIEAASAVISGDMTVAKSARENAGYAVTEALKAAGVNADRANEIGAGVDSYLMTGKTDALEQAAFNAARDAVNSAIDAISGLTPEQKKAAKEAAMCLMDGKPAAEVAREAVGEAVSQALERVGVSKESAGQIGQGITDVLKDASNTDNLVKGGINAAIDAIPGLTDAQREAVRNRVTEILAGTSSFGEVLTDETRKAIATALEKAGIDSVKAQAIANDVTNTVANLFAGNDVEWSKLGGEMLDAAKDVVLGENGLLVEWINNSDIPDELKPIATALVAELSGDEGALIAAGREALLEMLVEKGIPLEYAETIVGAAGSLASTYLEGGDVESVITGIVDDATTIFCTEVGKMIDKQLGRLCEKYPIVKKLFAALEITGEKIVHFLMKLNVATIKAAFDAICDMSWEDWKNLLTNLYDALKDWAIDKLCNYINGEIDKVLDKLLKKAMTALSKVKGLDNYMALIQFGGTMVTDITGAELKNAINSSGAKLQSLFDIRGSDDGKTKP